MRNSGREQRGFISNGIILCSMISQENGNANIRQAGAGPAGRTYILRS